MLKLLQILSFILGLCIFCPTAFGASDSGKSSAWETAAQKYRSAALTKMDMEKTVKAELGDKVYEGQLYLAKGVFRIEIQKPEKSLQVFDGKYIWSEDAASADFGGKTQITKLKVDSKNATMKLLAQIFEKGTLQKLFKVESEKKVFDEKYKHDIILIKATPKTKDLALKLLILGVDPDKQLVTEIGYIDDIENQTIMKFSNVEFKSDSDKKLFEYKPAKKAQVNEL